MSAETASPTKPRRLNKWQLLAILLLLASVVVLGLWLRETNKPTATKQETEMALQEAVNGTDQEAISRLTVAYNDAASDEGKANAAYYLAAHYDTIGDYDKAFRYFREADELGDGKNIDIILGVAKSAVQMGNKKIATEYYQKAIDHYKALGNGDASLANLIASLEARLSEITQE